MNQEEVKNMIKVHEGYSHKVYKDTVGVLTCGWGHALHEGSRVPMEVNEVFFKKDFKIAQMGTERLIYDYDLDLNAVRHAVITDMMFNLGYAGVKKFKKFIKAMQQQVWQAAAYEMINSKWYGQVGRRAEKLVEMMRTGKGVI